MPAPAGCTPGGLRFFHGVAASFVHDAARGGQSRRIVMLLQTCFRGTFEGVMIKALKDCGRTVRVHDSFGAASPGSSSRHRIPSDLCWRARPSAATCALWLFTRHIINGLPGGDAGRHGDGEVGSRELHGHVLARTRGETTSQRPKRCEFGPVGQRFVAASPLRRAGLLPPHVRELPAHARLDVRALAIRDLARGSAHPDEGGAPAGGCRLGVMGREAGQVSPAGFAGLGLGPGSRSRSRLDQPRLRAVSINLCARLSSPRASSVWAAKG
jgi:hypothetical protein